MEYLIFGSLVCIFFVSVIISGIVQDRRKQKEFIRLLRTDYGHLRKRDYSPERFLRMDRYYQKHRDTDQIDDITWNDLGMDEIFKKMNHTYSSIGEEYLYYLLRTTGKTKEELEAFEQLVRFFAEHEDQRVYLQFYMAKLGYMGKYSLYDYIDNLDYLGERSSKWSILRDLLFLPLLALLPFYFSYAFIGLIALMILNCTLYFREKSTIEPYIISFVYVLKLLDMCEKIEKVPELMSSSPVKSVLEKIRAYRIGLKPLKRGSFWVTAGNGSLGGNPEELLVDYLKMTFHIDLIQFNKMLNYLRTHVEEVDGLCTELGRLETAIAVGAFRKGIELDGGEFAIPEFADGKDPVLFLDLKNAYHPLLKDPVTNSIRTERGILVTGSNASGKSTFLKTVAINAVLAQTIHTCTAGGYRAPFFRIFSSMALRDDLEGGDSYYMVEIKALKRVLDSVNSPGRPVLCFVDEVLRGTNTVERIAASTQILKSLSTRNALCFAATHDVELTDLLEKEFANYHFTEEVSQGDVLFSYRLLAGKADSRNAIRLLEIMGYDQKLIAEAEDLAGKFLKEGCWT